MNVLFRTFAVLPLLMPAAAAWQYHLPETYVLPSAVGAMTTNTMGERHGGSSLGWSGAELTIPLADPRRSGWDDWYVNAAVNLDYTRLHTSGDLKLPHDNLWQAALPFTLIHPMPSERRLILSVGPQLATDGAGRTRSLQPAGFADFRLLKTDTLTLSAGVAYAPNETSWVVLPFATFEWTPTPDWTMSLQGYRMSALYTLADRKTSVGLFAKGVGGSWAVHGEEGTRLFRLRGMAVGPRIEHDFSAPGQTKRIWYAELGSTLFTTASFYRYSDTRNSLESRHYHPGLYLSAGVDFRF